MIYCGPCEMNDTNSSHRGRTLHAGPARPGGKQHVVGSSWSGRFDSSRARGAFKAVDRYYLVWAFFVPITSVLVFPSVQGTTPGYLMCFLSLAIAMLYGGGERTRYLRILLTAIFVWVLLFTLTQLADLTDGYTPDLDTLSLVNPYDHSFVMRASLFTQSLYVVAVVLYGTYLYVYYDDAWDRIIVASGVLFAVYGLYECAYYLVTGQPGDFLSNRQFTNTLARPLPKDIVTGSDFQTMGIGGISMQRLKSLTGEPSMYALSMFPFWVYARTVQRSRWPAIIIGASLVMTASTTAMVGYLCHLGIRMMHARINIIKLVLAALAIIAIIIVFNEQVVQLADDVIIKKLTGANSSGQERSAGFMAAVDFWLNAPVANKLVGIGFGYIRTTDMFSTLLVNNGLLGLALFSVLLLYPAFKLDWAPKAVALRQCCVATYVMMMVSVPEFSYLAPWTFVAFAYCRLYHRNRARQAADRHEVELTARTSHMREA
ncbi:hypothetical protein IHE32_07770 [Mycetohabitans rhizoxinica]